MAHDHGYALTILKTPQGYLTKEGFSQDINSKDIIVLPSNTYGKWSSMLTRIEYFLRETSLKEEVCKEIFDNISDCETIAFRCRHGVYCNGCIYRSANCEFWDGHRDQLKLSKLY